MLPAPTRGTCSGVSFRRFPNCSFLFLTYPDVKAAENALIVLEGTPFGKAHTLYVNRFGDIEKYANLPIGEGELPPGWKEKPYVERVSPEATVNKECTDV